MIPNVTDALAQIAPWLFAMLVKTSLLLAMSLAATQLMTRRSAALRHFIHAATMLCVLLLPLAAPLLPELRLAVLPPAVQEHMQAVVPTQSSIQPAPTSFEVSIPHPKTSHTRSLNSVTAAATSMGRTNEYRLAAAESRALAPAPVPAKAAFPNLNRQQIAVLLWIAGMLVCLLRMAILQVRLWRLVQRAEPVDSITLSSHLRWLCRDLGIQREVVLLASRELDVPIAAGVSNPKIVLSPQSGEWSESRRKAVLCHELAHIKRFDGLTQFISSVAAAIYWCNPLAWLTLRAMRAERERACDDYVLTFGTAASDYAHELLEIVSTVRRPQPAAALAMARRSQLEGRVLALLSPCVRHNVLPRRTALFLSASIFAVSLPLAAAHLQQQAAPSKPDMAPGAPASAGPTSAAPAIAPGPQGGVVGGVSGGAPATALAPTSNWEGTAVAAARSESDWKDTAQASGLPEYPGAISSEHTDGRGTVYLADGVHVRELSGGVYFSGDAPAKVIAFYRDRLNALGRIFECVGGRNRKTDFEVTQSERTDPSACNPDEFAQNGTELKLVNNNSVRAAVILPSQHGSEIALVRYELDSAGGNRENFEYHHNTADQEPPPFDCFRGKSSEHTNISSHSDDDGNRTWTASWTGSGCSIEAHSSGEVRFNAEATAIESISSGGYFEVDERSGDNLRRLRVEPASNGQLAFTYKLNGTQHEFDADARAWYSHLLVQLERVTGFAANTRVPALLAKGGPQAVLDEIGQLQTDYVRQVYFTKLFENATLPGPMLVKALDQARNSISTDYSLAQVLLTIAQRYDLNDEAQRMAFLGGANKLNTDYEHSRVLIELLKRPNLSPQVLAAALQSAKGINTDYEKGRILTTLAGLSSFDEKEIATYLDLASAINTDYEHSRVLMALMEHHKLSSEATTVVLKSASTISTDYEKSRILLAVSQSNNFDETQIATYLKLVDSIGTDYERSRDLIALMQEHKLANDSVGRIISETSKIGTDYEKARVLTEAAHRYTMQGAVRDAYIKAANTIGTEYDRNRTLAAITQREMM